MRIESLEGRLMAILKYCLLRRICQKEYCSNKFILEEDVIYRRIRCGLFLYTAINLMHFFSVLYLNFLVTKQVSVDSSKLEVGRKRKQQCDTTFFMHDDSLFVS